MRRIRKIKDRKSVQQKVAVIDACISANIHNDLASLKFPVGMRKFASGDAAAINHVMVGTCFLHDLAVEGERRCGRKNCPVTLEPKTGSRADVVESSGFSDNVVSSVIGF